MVGGRPFSIPPFHNYRATREGVVVLLPLCVKAGAAIGPSGNTQRERPPQVCIRKHLD